MPPVTAFVLSLLLLVLPGCATSDPPSITKQEKGKKDSKKEAVQHDQEKAMNEQSQRAIMDR
jgi:hypothetical protein